MRAGGGGGRRGERTGPVAERRRRGRSDGRRGRCRSGDRRLRGIGRHGGGRRCGARFGADGVSTRDGATGLGCAAGAGGAGRESRLAHRLGNPGAGKTSRALMPGGTLASQAMRPSTTTWAASEPDMQMPRVTAGSLSRSCRAKARDAPGSRRPVLGRAGQDGEEAGSLMSPLLPRCRRSPTACCVCPRAPGRLEGISPLGRGRPRRDRSGISRSTNETGMKRAKSRRRPAARCARTSAFRSGLAVGEGREAW